MRDVDASEPLHRSQGQPRHLMNVDDTIVGLGCLVFLIIGLVGVIFRRQADELAVRVAALNPTVKRLGNWEAVARRGFLVLALMMVAMGGVCAIDLLTGGAL